MHKIAIVKIGLLVVLFVGLAGLIPGVAHADGREIWRSGNGIAQAIAWRADNQQLAVGGSMGIWLYAIHDLKLVAHLTGNEGRISAMAWNPNGKQIVTASPGNILQLWDVASGKTQVIQQATDAEAQHYSSSVTFSPDGAQFASTSYNKAVHIWNSATGKQVMTLPMAGPVYSVAWHPRDARIAVSGVHEDQVVLLQVWDTKTGKLLNDYVPPEEDKERKKGPATSVQWTNGGKAIAARFSDSSANGCIEQWVPGDKYPFCVEGDVGGSIQIDFSYSLDGQSWAIARQGGNSCSITIHTEVTWGGLDCGARPAMTWSLDGHYLAAIGDQVYVIDGTIPYNGPPTPRPTNAWRTITDFREVPNGVEWSDDGQHMVYVEARSPQTDSFSDPSNYYLESLLFKDLITGENLWGWNQKQFGMFGLENVQLWCLRPDRKALAVVGEGGGCQYNQCIRVWGKDSEYRLLEEIPPDGPAFDPSKLQFVRWSSDGTRLAAFSEGGGLATWDAQTGKLSSNTQIGRTDNLQWSPGNRYLAALPAIVFQRID